MPDRGDGESVSEVVLKAEIAGNRSLAGIKRAFCEDVSSDEEAEIRFAVEGRDIEDEWSKWCTEELGMDLDIRAFL